MTTEQIKELRARYLPGNFQQYRAELREEARRLGHKVGANDIISVLEANANDDNRVIIQEGDGKTPTEVGKGRPDASGTPKEPGDGEVRDGGKGEGNPDANPSGDDAPKNPETGEPVPAEPAPEPLPEPKPIPMGDGESDEEKKADAKRDAKAKELWDDLFGDEDADAKAKRQELERQMKEADEAEAAAKKKAAEAERLRRELDELRRKQEERKRKREEEERRRREEEELRNMKHYKTDELIETLKTTGLAYLVGPAGTGKSTLAMDACVELFGVPKDDFKFPEHFAQISFSPDTTSGEMVGRCDINGVFHRSEVVRVFSEGGLILFDEIDNADASMLVKLNTAIANGTFATPEGLVRRNKNTVIVCTANTYGTGPDAMYVGRTRLDAATLDRFVCSTIEVDYDEKLEGKMAHFLPAEKRNWLKSFVKKVRTAIKEKHFRRLCSTRFVINAVRWFGNGKDEQFIRDRFFVGWMDNERKACNA